MFSAILLYKPRTSNAIQTRWTPEMRDSIYAHYRLDRNLADTFVYVPTGDANAHETSGELSIYHLG